MGLKAVPLQQETYKDQAYRLLRRAILEGDLKPGEPLVASRLSQQLGISRTPVREAVQALEKEGWVERRRSGGVRVSGLSMDQIEELFAIRGALEGLACRYAAERMTPTLLRELRSVHAESVEAVNRGSTADTDSLGRAFHGVIHRASGFRLLESQLSQMRDHINRYRRLTIATPGRVADAVREHAEILEALERGDGSAAEAAMRKHIHLSWLVTRAALAPFLAQRRGTAADEGQRTPAC